MNYIVTKRPEYFKKIGSYAFMEVGEIPPLPSIIAFDMETEGLEAHNLKLNVFAIQIGTGRDNFLIDMETIAFEEIKPLLIDKVLIGHNITFDLGWLYQKYNFWPKQVGDTMIASMILHNGKKEGNVPYRHGFAFVMEREMGLSYDKGEQKNIHKIKLSTQRAIQYCFNDVDRLLDLHSNMVEKLTKRGAIPTYRLHRQYIRALSYMEQCGMPVNKEKWEEKCVHDIDLLAQEAQAVRDYICETNPKYQDLQGNLFGETIKRVHINLGSSKQMIPIFEGYGINVQNPDDPEKKSIKADVISKTKHPFVDIWLKYQEIRHDVTTYGVNLTRKIINGTFFTRFNPILDTARISTRRGEINIMNFPKGAKTRECFEAHEGFVMVVSDYAQQEVRVGGDITGDEATISFITDGVCMHCAFARVLHPELKDLSDKEIKKHHDKERQAAKSPRFCFQFGGSAYTLHQNEGIPLEEAYEIEAAYKKLHYGIYDYGHAKFKEATAVGYIESTAGFRLHLPDFNEYKRMKEKVESFSKAFWEEYREGKVEWKEYWKCKEEEKEYVIKNQSAFDTYKANRMLVSDFAKKKAEYFKLCLNNPTQTTAAHQTKAAIVEIFDHIVARGHQWRARISAAQHDEIVMEVEEELAQEYISVMEKAMVERGNDFLVKKLFSMEADAHIGANWHAAKMG